MQFGNLHLVPALFICYVHFNCSHFSVETEFTFGSDIGHSKFPIQADKGEHSWQLSGWCQLKVFCSILLKSFQNSCILKICMFFQRIDFKVYIFTAVIHWGRRMRVFFRTSYWIDLKVAPRKQYILQLCITVDRVPVKRNY